MASRADLRSRGFGQAGVSAVIGERRAETQVEFTWPWLLFLASLLGGTIGGLLSRKDDGQPDGQARPLVRAAVGAVVGTVMVMLILTGLTAIEQVPRDVVGTSAGAFVIALLAGLGGLPLLHKVAPSLG